MIHFFYEGTFMSKRNTTRQTVRKTLILVTFLAFPIIYKYFSPWIIEVAALEGIINGNFITFLVLFLASLFLGRAWCSWLCPGGSLEEVGCLINTKSPRGGKLDWIKWGIWTIWLGLIVVFAISAGGYHTI
jgi:polyferredoxin